MRHQSLQYYMHDGPKAFRFELAGNLSREAARSLDQDWCTASSAIGDRRLIVDITFVTGVDELGHALIARWHREGAQLIANSKASRALAESILGDPLPEPPLNRDPAAASNRTWPSFHSSFLVRAVILPLLAIMVFPIEADAAMLRPETVADWDVYLQSANSTKLQDRLRPGGSFLWTFEDPERASKVHRGEIVVAPLGENPRRLYSVARLEERDGGVYSELEALALSRNIPAALRVVVDPIVRRVSRNSLTISLKQTEEAVSGKPADAASSEAHERILQ
jgi:hypothetical protein